MKQVLGWLAAILGTVQAQGAAPLWIPADQARELSPLMVHASRVGLDEVDSVSDFLIPLVVTEPDAYATNCWADFSVRVPAAGTYALWGRVRCPSGAGESFRVEPAAGAPSGAEWILEGTEDRRWSWVKCGTADLPAGDWAFRVRLFRAAGATTFGPLRWKQGELTQTPRFDLLCLASEPGYAPTDAAARLALGRPEKPAPPAPRAVTAPLPALADGAAPVDGRQRVPEWMRCPRWFTKDSWRAELRTRRAGDIAALVRETAANGGSVLRLSVLWGGETYYPSRVAPHAPGLGKLDYLREALDEGARTGVRIVAYINPNSLYEGHPLDTACRVRNPDGSLSTEPAYGRPFTQIPSYYVCVNHPRYREFLRNTLKEIFGVYGAHGLYVDGLTPHGCYCEHCRAKWRAMFGTDMPVEKLAKINRIWCVWGEFGHDPQPIGDVEGDPDARRITEMFLASFAEVTREFSRTVKAAKPDAATMFHSHPKPGCETAYDGTLTEVYTPQPWVHTAWRSGELAGYSAVHAVPVMFNIYPHRHFTEAEARHHALQGLAAGAYPNFWSAAGMKPVFDFMARSAEALDFATAAPVKFLAFPRDIRTSDTQRRAPVAPGVRYGTRDRFLAPYVGAYSALMRAGLPVNTLNRPGFEMALPGHRVLVLANLALMSDAQVDAVRRFVNDGGGLIATHETSLYDEKGRKRPDFALADVFGARHRATLPAAPRAAVFETAHAVVQGLQARTLAHNEEPMVDAAMAGAAVAARLGDLPAILVHTAGKGRVVYLPGRYDSAQCFDLSPAIERLFANAVRW
ncbi:MAG: beta-galactosidase trimerization domain-containing protein, partial [Verrucomicrobia bacterium]|nr:beta-galactosidase trimerization domain-containing protein [Verrucomicrobiota bacterium]